jgi:two-component system sensor histidine kinase SenX3
MTAAERRLYDFLFRQTTDGILILNREGQIEAYNPAFARLLKLGDLQLASLGVQMLFEDNPPLYRLLVAPDDQSTVIRLLDQHPVRVTVTTLDDGHRAVLFQDTAEQSMLAAMREKFARVIAHDLRNPVAVLIGFSALLETSGQLDEEHQGYLARIQETSTKLHYAAADLVELAWIEAGLSLESHPVDFTEAASRAIASLAKLMDEHGVTVSTSYQEVLPQVSCDTELLMSAVRRLVHNAILYSGSGKSISLRLWSEMDTVYCAVMDEGIGIDESELEVIFNRFYRSSDPRVQALPGGGLGLTFARKFAQHYGGDISVTSVLEQGSTFTLRLSAIDQRASASQ